MITASLSEQPATTTIPSQRPVLAGRDATQADKTNGLATHPERCHQAPGHGAWLQALPGSLLAAMAACLRGLCPVEVLLFMFGKCIQGSSQKHLQSSYLIATL